MERDIFQLVSKDPSAVAERVRECLVPLVATVVRDLPPDLKEEVVQESVIAVMCSPRYDALRGTPETYFKFVARSAGRKVRSVYAPPGQRTRDRHTHTHSLDEQVLDGVAVVDTIKAPLTVMGDVVAGTEVQKLLALADETAPHSVAEALHLVYESGQTLTSAAQVVGVHRLALRRSLDRWVEVYLADHPLYSIAA